MLSCRGHGPSNAMPGAHIPRRDHGRCAQTSGLSWLAMVGQGTPATTLLNRCGVSYRLHTYLLDKRAGSYGAEAAAALGLAPQCVFKTLIAELDGRLIVAVVPVSALLACAPSPLCWAPRKPRWPRRPTPNGHRIRHRRYLSARPPQAASRRDRHLGAAVRHRVLQRRSPRAATRAGSRRTGASDEGNRGPIATTWGALPQCSST